MPRKRKDKQQESITKREVGIVKREVGLAKRQVAVTKAESVEAHKKETNEKVK